MYLCGSVGRELGMCVYFKCVDSGPFQSCSGRYKTLFKIICIIFGSVFHSIFPYCRRHGKGIQTFPEGFSYKGEFSHNFYEGR